MNKPGFDFYVAGLSGRICPGNPLWNKPLPSGLSGCETVGTDSCPTYGDYFEGTSAFIFSDCFAAIDSSQNENIGGISITIEKHGALYHPGRICVSYGNGQIRNFVINLAAKDFARTAARNEFLVLKKLKTGSGGRYIPEVYVFGDIQTSSGAVLSMFTGEWLDGFHEFHFSEDNKNVVVWDPAGNFFLSSDEASEVFRNIALILTVFYDTGNFSQIYPWHHAAGDFIASRNADGRIDIRLITARQYGPIFHSEDDGLDDKVLGLFYFLINMTIRMRVDRLDGTGVYVWADDFVLVAAVSGFVSAAAEKMISEYSCLDVFAAGFSAFSKDDVLEMCRAVFSSSSFSDAENALVAVNIEAHSELLFQLLSESCLM